MRGDRVTKMKQRLPREKQNQHRNRHAEDPARHPLPLALFLPRKTRRVVAFGVVDGAFPAERRDDGRFDPLVDIGLRRGLEGLRVTQRNGRRAQRKVIVIGVAALRTLLRRQRYQRRKAIKDRMAVTAPYLSGAQLELWRGDPEDRVAAGTASKLFVSHRLSGCPRAPPILLRCSRRR